MNRTFNIFMGAGLLGLVAASANAQVDITRWNFTAVAASANTPAPTTGTGSASIINMDLNPLGDVTQSGTTTAPDPNSLSTGWTWRVRGGTGASGATTNGWDKTAAEYTQGAQLLAGTVGYTNIKFDFDWFSTNNGIRDLALQYTLNGTTWTNYSGTFSGGGATETIGGVTQLIATPNYYNLALPANGPGAVFNEADFSGIAGASNNANFGVRLVSAFGTDGVYDAATLVGGAPAAWNGLSGNWRFDQLAFRGTVSNVPEPATLAVLGLGIFGLVRRKRNRA